MHYPGLGSRELKASHIHWFLESWFEGTLRKWCYYLHTFKRLGGILGMCAGDSSPRGTLIDFTLHQSVMRPSVDTIGGSQVQEPPSPHYTQQARIDWKLFMELHNFESWFKFHIFFLIFFLFFFLFLFLKYLRTFLTSQYFSLGHYNLLFCLWIKIFLVGFLI